MGGILHRPSFRTALIRSAIKGVFPHAIVLLLLSHITHPKNQDNQIKQLTQHTTATMQLPTIQTLLFALLALNAGESIASCVGNRKGGSSCSNAGDGAGACSNDGSKIVSPFPQRARQRDCYADCCVSSLASLPEAPTRRLAFG